MGSSSSKGCVAVAGGVAGPSGSPVRPLGSRRSAGRIRPEKPAPGPAGSCARKRGGGGGGLGFKPDPETKAAGSDWRRGCGGRLAAAEKAPQFGALSFPGSKLPSGLAGLRPRKSSSSSSRRPTRPVPTGPVRGGGRDSSKARKNSGCSVSPSPPPQRPVRSFPNRLPFQTS